MSKLFMTGDMHGSYDMQKLTDFQERFGEQLNKDDFVMIAGDFGVIWTDTPDKEETFILTWLDSCPWTTIFIDGNHENHPRLATFPEVEFHGARAHQISKTVYHIMRGEVLEIEDLKLLCIGGADSHDKHWRTENEDWWAEERITQADIDNALTNLAKHDNKVSFVVSHSFPTSIMKRFFPYMKETPSSNMLEFILANAEIEKSWISGHYHVDKARREREGNFRLIYDDIIMLYTEENKEND